MAQRSIPDPPGFRDLSKSDQIEYLQALWDSLSEHPDEIRVPESHLEVSRRRLQAHRRNPEASRPATEVIDRLEKNRR